MPEDKAKKDKKIKRKIDIKKYLIIFSIIELILVVFISILFYLTIPLTSSKVVFIPQGSTKNALNYLDRIGYDLNSIDYFMIRFLGFPQSGWIDLKETKMTKYDFLYKLTTSKAAMKRVTLIPGETYYFFLRELQTKLKLDLNILYKEYNKYSYKKDGNILAESYDLPIGMSESEVMFYLTNYTNKKYEEFSKKIFGEYNIRQWYYYVSIASVIQKESANAEEMPVVGSVVYNRLKKGMPLQMDGTLNYGKYSHERVTAKRIKEDESDYNTYKNKGVPQNPVCAVDLNAIKSAIFPAKTDYLYFVRDKTTGLHKFSESYNSHKNAIQKNIKIERELIKIKENEKASSDSKIEYEKIEIKKQIKETKNIDNSIVNKTSKEFTTKESSMFEKKENKKEIDIKSLWENIN